MFRYILPFILLLMVGCSSKKVDIDYDPLFQINSLKTFAVVHKSKEGYDILNDERVSEAIKLEMESKGYVNVAEDAADFFITFESIVKKDVPSNIGVGLGLGTFSSGLGLSLGTVRGFSSDEGTLFINMINPATQKIFWYALLTQKIDDFESPQERTDYFNKTVGAMLKEFPAK